MKIRSRDVPSSLSLGSLGRAKGTLSDAEAWRGSFIAQWDLGGS